MSTTAAAVFHERAAYFIAELFGNAGKYGKVFVYMPFAQANDVRRFTSKANNSTAS